MKLLKRYIGYSVSGAILAVLLVIIGLDILAAIVDQLGDIKGSYGFLEILIFVFLSVPSSLYNYLPLSCLVGCMLGLGVLAGSSELVIMQASGVSLAQLIWAIARPVIIFIVAGALIGEYVAPYTDQYAESRRALAQGHKQALQSKRGVWNREGNEYMHFNAVLPNGKLFGITRFKFDEQGRIEEASFVDSAIYQGGYWFEQDGMVTRFNQDKIENHTFATRRWYSDVSPALLNILVLDTDELPMQRLYNYANYLQKQNVDASEYRLAFWQKALQPLATLSLVMIAISFIFGPLRQVTMGFRVFVGVIVGLVFQTSQKLLGPSSIIYNFSPILAVMVPIAACFIIGIILLRRAQ